jgi:uncharacterized protein YndB with AHSA1/START domain
MSNETDRIERSIVINAPRERVWRAVSSAEEFGTWFGVNLKGMEFVPGERTRGQFTISGHEHITFDVTVDRVEAPNLLSYFWRPYAVKPDIDYAAEEPTLVTFTLADAPGNATLLTVVESGFDKVPAYRREEALRMNTRGWEFQLQNIARHLHG